MKILRPPEGVNNTIGGAKFYSRSHNAEIRVCDEDGSVIDTHEQNGRVQGVGRGCGVGRGLGVGVDLGAAVGVDVAVAVGLGLGVIVAVAVGVGVGVTVGVGVAVGVGVGVGVPVCAAQYLPPVLKTLPGTYPPQTIISLMSPDCCGRRPDRGRVDSASGCPRIRAGIVSSTGVKKRDVIIISTPDDHFAASPHRSVKVSCRRYVGGAGSCPTVRAWSVSSTGVENAAGITISSTPDDHLGASPDCCVVQSGHRARW